MLWRWWLTEELFILSTCLTTLNTCELVVDGTVVGKTNKEEKTRDVAADIGMYHFIKYIELVVDDTVDGQDN